MDKINIYVGLIHHPVYNKQQEVVTTSITNMDIHDIARTCKTYGITKYLVINPLQSQRDLYGKIISFWQSEIGKKYQRDRALALENITFLSSLAEANEYIKKQEGTYPLIMTTTAKERAGQIAFDAYPSICKEHKPLFLVFGTGYGLAEELHLAADYVLQPVSGSGEYNHLSVRSAVAIVLDRLLLKNKGGKNGFNTSC